MLSDFIKNLDLFSQSIEFNSSKQSFRKRTLLGASLTIIIVLFSILYFIYLLVQYYTGQIEPKYRSQTFVANDDIDIPMNSNLVGFQIKKFDGNLTLDQMQKAENKTYISFVTYYQKRQGSTYNIIYIDLKQCEDPQLEGYMCFDFKNVPDKNLVTGIQNNFFSLVSIAIYRCQETDYFKTFVSNNCASPEEIDDYIETKNAVIDLKIQTSQYNTSSHQMQVSYKHYYSFLSSPNQIQLKEIRLQKQISLVKEGQFIQHESEYSSPISYNVNSQVVQKTNKQASRYDFLFAIGVDETFQLIKIQYVTFPELLAQCNTTIALLMSLGFLGKFMAKKLIKQEIFLLILKTLYQETYQKILKLNNIQHFRDIYSKQIKFSEFNSDYVIEEIIDPILLPSLEAKSGEQILTQSINQRTRYTDNKKEQFVPNLKTNESTDKKYLETEQSTDISQIRLQARNEKSKYGPKIFKSIIKDGQLNNTSSQIQHTTIEPQINSQNKNKKLRSKQQQQRIQTDPIKKEMREQAFKKIYDRINCQNDSHISKKADKALFNFRQSNQSDINKSLDFLHFYKEIILLKKAVMMILSKDQYAALQIVGCQDNYLCNENDYISLTTCKQLGYLKNTINFFKSIIEQDKTGNYFQEQLLISQSDDLQTYFIQNFIEKCNSHSANISQVDQRIYSSLI